MRYTIYRGSQEIGGSFIEIRSGSAKVLFDMGYPVLPNGVPVIEPITESDPKMLLEAGLLPPIKGLYHWDVPGFDAVILSYAQLDDAGLLQWLHPDIPVWVTAGTRTLIELAQRFRIIPSSVAGWQLFSLNRPFSIKGMVIKPYQADASAFDAVAFEIQADGQTILYTGDLHVHGRKSKCLDNFLKHAVRNADVLFAGAMIGRTESTVRTEDELEQELVGLMMEPGPFLFQCSNQDVDRIVTLYNACRSTRRIFVIDLFTANILHELRKLGFSLPSPEVGSDVMHVFPPRRATRQTSDEISEDAISEADASRFSRWHISEAQIQEQADRICMLVRPSMLPALRKMTRLRLGQLIYSMYHAYRQMPEQKRLEHLMQSRGTMIVPLQAGGHGRIRDLQQMIESLQPKTVVLVHDFRPERFSSLSDRIRIVHDGIEVVVQDQVR